MKRWYVVIVMCLIYAINIADRYVVSTVLEPIRLDLRLTDAGVAFLTGVPLAGSHDRFKSRFAVLERLRRDIGQDHTSAFGCKIDGNRAPYAGTRAGDDCGFSLK